MEKIENFSFEYSLSKDDYLNYSLYNTNQLKSIQKDRLIFKISLTLVYLIIFLGVSYILEFNLYGVIIYFLITVFFVGRLWLKVDKNRYIRAYKKIINETFDENSNQNIILNFYNDKITYKALTKEIFSNYSDIRQINEIEENIFIKLSDNSSLIINKKFVEIEKIKSNLKAISKEYIIPYNEELNWKFK